MGKSLFSCTTLMVTLFTLPTMAAFNFQEPTEWTVGDSGSTSNHWQASLIAPFSNSNSPPTSSTVEPAIGTPSGMGVQFPGFVATSGGYYSFDGDYWITADIYNHGGSASTDPQFASGYNTRVLIQTSSTTSPDYGNASVFVDKIEIVDLAGQPLTGGTNAELIGVTQLFLDEVETPFGLADLEELSFEFLLPEYSGDFKVRFSMAIHASFQDLRVDTLLVAENSAIPGDFNNDGYVDAEDLEIWQESYGDGLTGRDFLAWQRNYTGPAPALASPLPPATFVVPEPTSLMVVIFGIIIGLANRAPTWNRPTWNR